jgi:hypothetical protein
MTEALAKVEAVVVPAARRLLDGLKPGYRSQSPVGPGMVRNALDGAPGSAAHAGRGSAGIWESEQLLGQRVRTPHGELAVVRALFTPARGGDRLGRWALVLLDDGEHHEFDVRELAIVGGADQRLPRNFS